MGSKNYDHVRFYANGFAERLEKNPDHVDYDLL